jgi:hypothetical protein
MPKNHLHKRLNEPQIQDLVAKYSSKQISAKEACRFLGIGRTRLHELTVTYRTKPNTFQVGYKRNTPNNKLKQSVKEHILKELSFEKEKIIDNPDVPTTKYNYSYIKNLIQEKYSEQVSLPTIISLAKANDFWKAKRKREQVHTRQVLTNFVGELIQHDSSHHLFAPDALKKWYLITSLDDYSRKLLHARLVLVETTWIHIQAVEDVCLRIGVPFSYYVDQHSIFRYVKDRDKFSIYTTYTKFTGDVDTQWNTLLKDISTKPIFALSPEAKGKIERPYQWLQDHLVRTCVRYGITDIAKGQYILDAEVTRYNSRQVHSVTGEIPDIRFNKAIKEGKTLFRPFTPQAPFTTKDIFSLRETRTTDGYRSISLFGTKLRVPHVDPYRPIDIRMFPDIKTRTVEVRLWHEKKFLGSQTLPAKNLPGVHF